MDRGNKPVDGGNLIIEADEYEDFIKNEPQSEKYIRRFVGAEEYINNKMRYCLWLVDAVPADLLRMPNVMKRIEKCKQVRLASTKAATRKSADTPMCFQEIRQPGSDYIFVPRVSSESRRYIPIGFLPPEIIASDVQIIPNATLYHFGILTSNVHMAWVRAVCGRLEMRYRYSNTIVYNNYPWPDATNEHKIAIEKLAQGVLDAREKYPESTLANMYGESSMLLHTALLNAHRELDKAVMKLYGFSVKDTDEATCVAALMEMYLDLVETESRQTK